MNSEKSKKIKKVFLVFISCVIIWKLGSIYFPDSQSKYEINLSDYSMHYQGYMLDSPNKKHHLSMKVHKKDKDSDVSYINGMLYKRNETNELEFLYTVYWEEVPSSTVKVAGEENFEACDAKWVDNSHVEINGRVVNIYEGYDYRKDESSSK